MGQVPSKTNLNAVEGGLMRGVKAPVGNLRGFVTKTKRKQVCDCITQHTWKERRWILAKLLSFDE